jgi:flagellar biosynthesis/type III secretory pathway protein FliH
MTTLETARVHRFRFSAFDGREEGKDTQKPKEEAPKAAAEPPPPGPMHLPLTLPAITEKDLQAAKADAQAQGYRDGYAAAQAKFDREAAAREEAVKSLLEMIANRITLAAEAHGNSLKEREALMGRLVIASARKVAGEALKREPYATVEALMKECMGLIAGKAKVTVTVSSTLAAGLRQRIDTLKPLLQNFNGELLVEEDEHLMDQDCRVEWSNGAGERSAEALWSAIEGIIMKTNVT